MIIYVCSLVIITLIFILSTIYIMRTDLSIIRKQTRDANFAISTLQEIACDHRVRVCRSGYCILRIGELSTKVEVPDNGDCLDFSSIKESVGVEYDDKRGKIYAIEFRVYGKDCIAYGKTPLVAWSNVVQKARKEYRRIFGRNGYIVK